MFVCTFVVGPLCSKDLLARPSSSRTLEASGDDDFILWLFELACFGEIGFLSSAFLSVPTWLGTDGPRILASTIGFVCSQKSTDAYAIALFQSCWWFSIPRSLYIEFRHHANAQSKFIWEAMILPVPILYRAPLPSLSVTYCRQQVPSLCELFENWALLR